MKTLLEWLMSFLLVVSIISNHDCNNNQHHCCCFQINAFIIKTNHRNYFHLKDKLGDTPLKKRRLAAVVGDNLGGHELSLSPPSNTKVGSSFLSSLSPQNSERDASSEKGKRSKIKIRSIINCKDQQELADHIRDNYDEIRHYHISFYWNAIANFAKPQQGQFQGKFQEQKLGQQITMFKPLLELTSDIFMKDSMVLQPKGLMLTIKSIARLNIWTGGIFASKNQRVWKIIETHILERKKKGFKKEEETASATMSWDTRDDDDDCELKVRDYVNIANTFANIRRRSDSLFKFIEHEILSSMESNQQNQEKNNMSLDPYHLSITVCAYVKSRYPAPKLFAAIASSAVCQIDAFQPKFLASMTYSFATCRHAAPEFFDAAAKVIILCNSGSGNNKRDSLNAQDIANTLWAYAKTGKSSPQLFDSMSQMMLDGSNDNNRNKLNFFNAQNIASTLWAYAKTRNSSPQLFDAMSQMMVSNDYRYKLKYFTTQEIANTLYAYAKTGNSSPELFDAMSQMMLGGNSDNIRSRLNSFDTQNIANTLWAYAKTGNSSPELFDAMSQTILGGSSNNNKSKLDAFEAYGIADTLWAYALADHTNIDPKLVDALLYKVIPMIATIPSSSCYKFNSIILWSLAVLDCTNPNRAIPFFTEIARQYHSTTTTNNNNNGEELLLPGASASQLYQASLWYIGERQQESLLPNSLQREIQSLMKTDYRPQTISRLQREVGEVLEKEVKYLREEVICSQTGYSIDIVVQNDDNEGEEIAFEVDGPSHFNNNRSPTGSTVLKRRQLRNLGTRQLISIPYWEWDKLKSEKKREYIRKCLQQQ